MSRRITISTLAALAALIATPAIADRECFEDSCRMPDVVEPPAALPPNMIDVVPPAMSGSQVQMPSAAPITAGPQMVVDPGPRAQMPRPAPRYSEERPARVVTQRPRDAGVEHSPSRAPRYVVNQGPTYGSVAVAGVPEEGVVRIYPPMRADPAWKRCQIDQRHHCGPYSYHPYGADGYRPYGHYRGHRSAPVYVLAPDARIIQIETDDD